MDKKRIWFLIRSFALLIVTCITVFLFYTILMKEKTNDSVKGVSDAYMEEINAQVHQKFQTFTYIRIDQVSGMVKRTPADPGIEWEELKKELATSTEVRGFQWLGLVRENGEVVTVYGEDLLSIDDVTLKNSIKEDGNIITRGRKQDKSRVFIFGTRAAYPLEDGTKSIAMIAAIDMSSVEGALFRDSKDSREDSYLISQEGDYIIRNGENLQGNYFERLRGYKRERHRRRGLYQWNEGGNEKRQKLYPDGVNRRRGPAYVLFSYVRKCPLVSGDDHAG